MFPAVPYIDWIQGRPETAEYDLGSSDLRRPAGSDVVPPALADVETPEDVELEAQIADEYGVSPSNVVVTAGATHANTVVAAATLDAEARALVEKPGYDPLLETPEALGADVHRFVRVGADGDPLDPAGDDYALDPERVDAALDEETDLVVVTNRHNPSGALTDRETLAAVADVAADYGALLHVDEVYAPFVSDTVEGAFGGPTAAGLENVVVTSSLTKFHGFGGLKIGWILAEESVVERVHDVLTHLPSVAEPSRRLAERFFADRDRLVEESRARLRRRHASLSAFVEGREDVSGHVHDGCSYAFVSAEGVSGDELVEAAWERGLLVVPGRFFDDAESVRISLGAEGSEAGLDVLGDVLDEFRR